MTAPNADDEKRRPIREGGDELYRSIRAGKEETHRLMRALHEDLVEHIERLGERLYGPKHP
jgi:hypothetical protein